MSFTQLNPSDFVVSSDAITAPAWSSNVPTLTSFYTASTPTTNGISAGAYYLNVYQQAYGSNGAAVQFAIAYGNINGSGSKWLNNLVSGVSPSLTTYNQYQTLVYGPEVTGSQGFNFGGAALRSPDIWVLNIDRNRYKQSLMPGTFNLQLKNSNNIVNICDNSNDSSVINYLDCGRVFNLVSGSYGRATSGTVSGSTLGPGYTASGSYGYYLPDIGTIILNPGALALAAVSGGIGISRDLSSNPNLPSSSLNNAYLYAAISASGATPTTGSLPGFQLNSQENVSSDYVFIRINNAEYNYSTNPTFTSGSSGAVLYSSMVYSPQTFVTTVGLYNNNSELLAVAKMSQALVKDFTKEALIRVKLDW